MITELLAPLVAARFISDRRYREGHLRVVNALPSRRVMGVHVPDMKRVATELSREDSRGWITRFEAADTASLTHEELIIWGMMINIARCTLAERTAMLRHFVPAIDNWAVCDTVCAHAKWMARCDKMELWNLLRLWFASRREFEVRFAIVCSMTYMADSEWPEELAATIGALDFDRIGSAYTTCRTKPSAPQQGTVAGASPYYVRMGVAWLLATLLARFPEHTRKFVRTSHLPDDVIKMYVRKAKESFRTRHISAL